MTTMWTSLDFVTRPPQIETTGKNFKGSKKAGMSNPFQQAIHLQNTPRKRGRPPKNPTMEYLVKPTPKLAKKKGRTSSMDLDYTPKSSMRYKMAKNLDVDENDVEDHNVDACVLCGLGATRASLAPSWERLRSLWGCQGDIVSECSPV